MRNQDLRRRSALYIHVKMFCRLLKCSVTRKRKEQFLSRKWLNVNEEVAYKIKTNSTNEVELRNAGIYLYEVRYKLDNKISKVQVAIGKGKVGL